MQPSSPPVPDQSLPPVPPAPAAVPPAGAPAMPPLPPNPASAAPANDTPAMADDGDLIEKEWVMKVKQVVNATVNDPYELNKQFSQIKADYMQKRYGKSIKSED